MAVNVKMLSNEEMSHFLIFFLEIIPLGKIHIKRILAEHVQILTRINSAHLYKCITTAKGS